MRPKPRILVDLQKSGTNLFKRKSFQVNLSQFKLVKIPLIFWCKAITIAAVFLYLVLGSVMAPMDQWHLSFAAQNDEERRELEKQLADLEAQIEEYQSTVDKYRSQGRNLEDEISRLNAKIQKLSLQIKSINLTLQKLDDEIEVNQNKIVKTEDEITKNKRILSRTLQSIYEQENLSLAERLLANPSLSAFFDSVSNLMFIQESLRGTLERVVGLRVELLEDKEQLATQKNDANALKVYQLSQKSTLDSTKKDKNTILQVTKGQEAKYQELVQETKKTAAQIRGRIFQLIGGGELTFERAYELAKFAEQATGMRAAMILAVLDRESALGQNVGRCDYQSAMHPTRDLPLFLEILEKLKKAGVAPPEPVKVSCPNRDGYFGGAMGPAQFIASTWVIYDNRIAEITGSNPPNPWSNADAFVGTALYLKDAYDSASCRNYAEQNRHISPVQLLQERCAAAKYYAGGRWYTYRWAYGQPVVEKADRFQQDIDILNS